MDRCGQHNFINKKDQLSVKTDLKLNDIVNSSQYFKMLISIKRCKKFSIKRCKKPQLGF